MALGDAGGGTPLVIGGVLQALATLHVLHIISQNFPLFQMYLFCFPKQCEPQLPSCSSAGPCPLPPPGWCLMAWP